MSNPQPSPHPLPQFLTEIPLPNPLPPLVLSVFTRPDLLAQVVEALRHQSLLPTQMIVLVDGPRSPQDHGPIQACIQLLEDFVASTQGRTTVEFIRRPGNLGCDRNVILGMTEILERFEAIVYLEDDVRPNPNFFDCICRLLVAYRDEPKIFSVSAYSSFPEEFYGEMDADFAISQRLFTYGWGIWSDRWQSINLIGQPPQANPFGAFYKIPATAQTKLTAINQFWLEKNRKTDWVISTTLAALAQGKVHLAPRASLTRNIGFGHQESETYRGREPAWANARYDCNFSPNRLPSSLELAPSLQAELTGQALAQFFDRKKLWLNGPALWFLLGKFRDWPSRMAWIRLFIKRFPVLVSRWRNGLPT